MPTDATPSAWEPRGFRVGEWTITALSDGFLRLDGGAMWGVVPAVFWRQWTPPDDANTIRMALRPFLCERGDDCVVIEPGVGDRWSDKESRIYRLERHPTLVEALATVGREPADVTHVVASHCHWDHIGAQVVRDGEELRPLFANARHFAPTIEIETARRPDHVRRASYRADDVEPILTAGAYEPYEGDAELLPGLRVHPAQGHSDGIHVVTLNEDEPGDTAIFWGDVVPTTHHVQPPYIMAYDIDVARSFASRSHWLERAAEGGWLGLFYHDEQHAFGRLSTDGRRYALAVEPGEPRGARGA